MVKKVSVTEKEKKTIEVEKLVEKFECSDGTLFNKEDLANKHEKILEYKQKISYIPFKKICDPIESIDKMLIGAYYVENKSDYLNIVWVLNHTCGYEYGGGWSSYYYTNPDWYIFYWDERGDDEYYYEKRLSEIKKEYQDFLSEFEE